MTNWKAQGGTESGIALVAGGDKSYMDTTYLAEPCTKTTGYLGTGTDGCTLLAAGSSGSGDVAVFLNATTTEFVVNAGGSSDFTIDYNTGLNDAGGAAYPTSLVTILNDGNGGDLDTMYDPKAAVIDDGLVIVICSVHDWKTATAPDNATTRQTAGNWDQQNRVAMVWKEIGDTSWNVVDDDTNAMVGALGNRWMIGRPIRPTATSLLVGFTNYTGKNASNGENRAYVSKFDKTTSWGHTATVEIISDADAAIADNPTDQHFHVVELDWDGFRLRAFLSIGDGMDQNGIFECSRPNLDIANDDTGTAAAAKSGVVIRDATASSGTNPWTRHTAFVHGGQTDLATTDLDNELFPVGAQPTWGVRIGDRIHFGADEKAPAIFSFDVTGAAGTVFDDARPEYLAHPIDSGTNSYTYLSLVGDSSNYLNDGTAKHACIIRPTEQYVSEARADAGTRVGYHNGSGWASIGNHGYSNSFGIGVLPGGHVVSGSSDSGLVRFVPGTVAAYTPIESSVAATNIMDGNTSAGTVAGRSTIVTTPGNTEGYPNSLDEDHDVHTFTLEPTAANAGNLFGTIVVAPADTSDEINDGDIVAVRVWMKSNGEKALWLNTIADGNTSPSLDAALPDQAVVLVSNEWVESLWLIDTTGSTASGIGLRLTLQGRRVADTPYADDAANEISICIEGIYLNTAQRPIQHPELTGGSATADTELVWTLPATAFPLTVKGITHPLGGSDFENVYAGNAFLYRLSAADTGGGANYIDFYANYSAGTLSYTGEIDGGAIGTVTIQSSVEWMKQTAVTIKASVDGTDLILQASILGEPYGAGATLATAGSVAWTTVTQDDGTNQGELMIGEIQAGDDGYLRGRSRGNRDRW